MTDIIEKTNCYTYKVEMIVQVLAKDLPSASNQLNSVGGHVSNRKIELLDTTELPFESSKINSNKKSKKIF